MKAISKRVLSFALALVMVLTLAIVPSAEAQAATGLAKSKTYYVGQTKTLKLTTSSSWKKVKTTWKSSKPSVVKISKSATKSATIKCLKKGTANVTAKVSYKKNGKTSSKTFTCKVTVKNPTFNVTVEKATLTLGETTKINVTKTPKSAVVKYSSDDTAIAKISGGKIYANGVGTTNINARLKVGSKSIKKSVAVTVVPAADGYSVSLSNPFTDEYKNTVLVNQNAVLNVSCVKDGKPVAGQVVVISTKRSDGVDAPSKHEAKNTTATTNAQGIAAFVIGDKGNYTGKLTAARTDRIEGLEYTLSFPGTSEKLSGTVAFAAVHNERIDVLNNNKPTDQYPNLAPGTNYPTANNDGDVVTASMDQPESFIDEYVESQQVSAKENENHAVYITGGYPVITIPGTATDVSAAEKEIEKIDFHSDEYKTYEAKDYYYSITKDPSSLVYATLNFDELKLSDYTHARIATYSSEAAAKADTNYASGANVKEYKGPQNQGAFGYQIPITGVDSKCVRVTLFSAGQVDDALNSGFKASSVEYVYKTTKVDGGVTYPVKDAKVTWSIVGSEYTAEEAVPAGIYTTVDGKYKIGVNGLVIDVKPNESLTYKMPRFPYTGTAILTHYDANGKVIAYYAYSTTNDGTNKNVLGQAPVTPSADNRKGYCYKITADELRDKVGTILSNEANIIKVDSKQSGRTTLEGKVTIAGKEIDALDATTNTVYSSIQWNPIPNSETNPDAFVALTGQNIEVIAQLIDKNGNAVTESGQTVSFKHNGTNITGANIGKITVVKRETTTDSKGQAKLILKASQVDGIDKISADVSSSNYNVKLVVADKAVDKADLYWVDAELAFTDKSFEGAETLATTSGNTSVTVSNKIAPKAGSTWYYAVKAITSRFANVGGQAGKQANIEGLKIFSEKTASSLGTVETTGNGQVKATSSKTGKTIIVNKINAASVDASAIKVSGADVTFAGVGVASINRTMKLEVQWQIDGVQAEILTPNGNVVSGNSVDVYVKVSDKNGNPVSGNVVELKHDGNAKFAGRDTVSGNTNKDGIFKATLQFNGERLVTVTGSVQGISDAVYSMTYRVSDGKPFAIETAQDDVTEAYQSKFNKDTKEITLVFTDDIVESSVTKDSVTAYYDYGSVSGNTVNMGVESVAVQGNVLTIKVVNVPGTIDADKLIGVKFATATDKSVDYTMTSVEGVQYKDKVVTFKPDAGKTAPSQTTVTP